jgi:hypothetical protein
MTAKDPEKYKVLSVSEGIKEEARRREREGERDPARIGVGKTKDPIRSLIDARRYRGRPAPEGQVGVVYTPRYDSSEGMKKGGKVKRDRRDGIALRGKTRA